MNANRRMSLLVTFLVLCNLFYPAQADDRRETNLERLRNLGFKVAPSLPLSEERGRLKLRPQKEIEARMDALHALVFWVVAPEGMVNDEGMRKNALHGAMSSWLTEEEKAIFQLSKAEAKAQHLGSIGWKMENVWALAWVLGCEEELALSGQLQGEQAREVLLNFCLKSERGLRSLSEVVAEEDLFYCAHNAVRSAQLGGGTVPEGFHPVAEGGGIHERRHALTWCLSPGVTWEDTDLST